MSEAKFTPGPWKATYDSQLQAAIEIYNTEDRIMVAVLPDRGTVEAMSEIEANANLIAAAPDMYEALEQMEPLINNSTGIVGYYMNGNVAKWNDFDVTRIIGNALRKARGEKE